MGYYKIVNKESSVYKELHQLRTREIEIGKENLKAIDDKVGLKWKNYLGHSGQQNFNRVTQFRGFAFLEPEKVDLKVWRESKEDPGVFVPNLKTKKGREMSQFLFNGLTGSMFSDVFDILKIETGRRFTFPFVEIAGDAIIIFLGDEHEPSDTDVIEITKTEFNGMLSKEQNKKEGK